MRATTPDTTPQQLPNWARRALWCLALLGLAVPWALYLRHFLVDGGEVTRFFQDAAANTVTSAITIDVYLAAMVFSVWVWTERRVPHRLLYVLLCFGVGLAFALPLYLLRRQAKRGPSDTGQ